MSEQRPAWIYLGLLGLSLGAWCLHDLLRLLPAAGLLGIILLAYLRPAWVARPALGVIILLILISFSFGYFVLFAGQHNLVQVSIYSFQLIQACCFSLLLLIAVQWFSWQSKSFDWLLFSLGLLLILSGISWQSLQFKGVYCLLALGFIALTLSQRIRPGRPVASGESKAFKQYYQRLAIILVMFISLSLGSMHLMEYADQHFSDMITRFLLGQDQDWSGFSGHTYLQGGQEIQLSEQIAFTLKASRPSEYWRGNILSVYRDGHWFPQETLHLPSATLQSTHDHWLEYKVSESLPQTSGPWIEIQMQNHYQGILFAPGQTQAIAVPAQTRLYQNQYQLYRRELRQLQHHYRLQLNPDYQPLAHWDQSILLENLELPAALKKQLQPLALELTAKSQSSLAKAQVIEQWFQKGFRYSLKVDPVPPGVDPTLDFVLNRKAAYCSWFASGMVLMLRSIGIPAHLVSGWRSMERNALAQVWVVKEKQAHDWVEVLDLQQNRWVRFDPTPADQLNQLTSRSSWIQQTLEGLGLWFDQLKALLSGMNTQERLNWIQKQALALLQQPGFYGLVLLALGLNQLLKQRKKKRAAVPRGLEQLKYLGADKELQGCLELLSEWLQDRQLRLPAYQTLDSWYKHARSRLSQQEAEQLAEVLERLQALRFGPDSAAGLSELKDLLIKMRQSASSVKLESIS